MGEQKPRLLLIVSVSVLLLIALVALQRGTASRGAGDREEQDASFVEDDTEEVYTNGGAAAKISVISEEEAPPPPKRRTASQKFRTESKEDYDAQLERSWGDSYVYGRVFAGKDQAIPGATIQLYENDPNTTNPPLREAVADQDGSFTLTRLHDGDRRFVLVTRAEGYAPEARFVYLMNQPAPVYIRMQKGVTLRGVVRDAETSAGLGGARIVHPTPGDQVFGVLGSIHSAPGGNFVFENCHPGAVISQASLAGYSDTVVKLRAPSEGAEILMVSGGATISGTAVSRLTGKPEKGAKIWVETDAFKNSVVTGEDGKFEFSGLPAGNYDLFGVRGMRSEKQVVELARNELKEDLVVELPSELFVNGKVVDANQGRKLPGIRIWYRSPSGRNSVLSDEDGLFAFETMALDEYTIQVHERGYLPAQEKRTSAVLETLTRKVPKNASSDTFILKLRRVPSVAGRVRTVRREGGDPRKVQGADVAFDYLLGEQHERLHTKTDVDGRFFFNLPTRRRGDGKLVAYSNWAIDAADVKIPQRRSVELLLKRTVLIGSVLLVDKTPLDGMKIELSHLLPNNAPEDRAIRIRERSFETGQGGRLIMPLPENQKVLLTFHLPDGKQIEKAFQSNQLLNRRCIFIYDPLSNDIFHDTGGGGRQRQGQNRKPQAGQQQKQPNKQGQQRQQGQQGQQQN